MSELSSRLTEANDTELATTTLCSAKATLSGAIPAQNYKSAFYQGLVLLATRKRVKLFHRQLIG